jgi:hypothetical protein
MCLYWFVANLPVVPLRVQYWVGQMNCSLLTQWNPAVPDLDQ